MAQKINLRSSKIKERQRQVQTYGTQTPLSSTAVERGQTRWLDGSRVVIEGLLDVTGLTTISGTLNVSGTTTLSGSTTIAGPTGITGALTIAGSMSVTGPSTFAGTLGINGATTITGELDVTGPTTLSGTLDIGGDTSITGTLGIKGDTTVTGDLDVSGPLDVTGTTSLAGVTTLRNDLNVTTGGKIKAGNIEIRPDAGGQIAMQGGAITSDSLGMGLVNQAGIQISSPNTKLTNLPTTDVAKANVHIDSSGRLWKVTNP